MDEREDTIRRSARKRTTLLQGAGFALLGHPGPAGLGLALAVISLTAILVVCFYPGAVTAWLALVSLLAVLVFSAAEYLAVGWIMIRPNGESSMLARHFMFICIGIYVTAIVAAACILVNFGTLKLNGDGMVPVVQPGELVLYQKRVVPANLDRGRFAAFRISPESLWGRPGDVVLARILAVPGDAIAIQDGHYQVNDKMTQAEVIPKGGSNVVLDVPVAPAKIIVPPDSFFVVQEQPATALDSRTLSWMRRGDVLGTRFWLVSRRGLGSEL